MCPFGHDRKSGTWPAICGDHLFPAVSLEQRLGSPPSNLSALHLHSHAPGFLVPPGPRRPKGKLSRHITPGCRRPFLELRREGYGRGPQPPLGTGPPSRWASDASSVAPHHLYYHLKHPPAPVCGKTVFHETEKVGDRWDTGLLDSTTGPKGKHEGYQHHGNTIFQYCIGTHFK